MCWTATDKRQHMRHTLVVLILLCAATQLYAGDDASGPVRYSINLSQPYTSYSMTLSDKAWSAALTIRFAYKGGPFHFVRTSLPLNVDGKSVEGVVYAAVEKPDVFYIARGDAMLKVGDRWAYSPGVGGFSMYAPKSRNFMVCFNFVNGGVPFLSSSPVTKGTVTWRGHDEYDRLTNR